LSLRASSLEHSLAAVRLPASRLQALRKMPPSQRLGRQLLQLYRQIMKVHRERLPLPMRDMGDSYARDEFRRHRDEKTTEQQWAIFAAEWRKYVAMLSGEADMTVSGDIPADVLNSMSQEQKIRLQILEEEARRALDNVLKDVPP